MKKILLLLAVFCFTAVSVFADEYIIGTGTTSANWVPVRATYHYGWSRMLYTKTELNSAGLIAASDILGLSFNVANVPDNAILNNQMIYMRHTASTSLTNTYTGTAGFTLVYSGSVRFHGTGWKVIRLDTPFAWNNTDNLEIMWENHNGVTCWANTGFRISNTTPVYKTVYNYQMNSYPNEDGYLAYGRPNLRISTAATTIPAAAMNPFPLTGADWVSTHPELTWQDGSGMPSGYKLYLGITNPPPYVAQVGYTQSWSPSTALSYNQMYYWKVVPCNAFGDAVDCPIWSFTTVSEGGVQIGDSPYEQYQPFGIGSGYERSTDLYTAAQLDNRLGILDEIGWQCTTNFTDNVPYKIYIKSTVDTLLTFRTWEEFVTGAQLVKEGVHQFDYEGWHNFILDTAFHYGGGNIIVGVETDYGGTGTIPYPYFRFSIGTTDTHQYWEQDDTPPLGSGLLNNNLPNIRLHISAPPTGLPQPPILIYPSAEAVMLPKAGFDFVWTPNLTGGVPQHYDLFIAHYENSIFHQHMFTNITTTSFNPAINGSIVFSYGEHCGWKVRAENAYGQATQSSWSWFDIEPDPTVAIPYVQSFDLYAFPPGWTQSFDGSIPTKRWLPSQTNYSGGTACELVADWCEGTGTSRLISPPINTDGLDDFYASFKHAFFDYATGLTGKLQFSHDLINWQDTGWSFTSGNGDVLGYETFQVSLDTPAQVTYLSWTLEGDHYQFYDWYLDEVTLSGTLIAPVVSITADGVLSWQPVAGAHGYRIYGAADPYGTYVLLESTELTTWQDTAFPQTGMFYRVTAVDVLRRK